MNKFENAVRIKKENLLFHREQHNVYNKVKSDRELFNQNSMHVN